MEGIVLPLVIVLTVIASLFRHIYHLPGVIHWTEIYFIQPIAASLPLLQIIFPIAWVSLNCYGLARYLQYNNYDNCFKIYLLQFFNIIYKFHLQYVVTMGFISMSTIWLCLYEAHANDVLFFLLNHLRLMVAGSGVPLY